MATPSSERDPFEQIAGEFRARLRAGEHPALEEYTERYPELADQVRELFPALILMERDRAGEPAETLEAGQGGSEPGSQERLGRFELLERIGQGSFGTVWRAYDTELRRPVALKVPRPGLLDDPLVRERFEREARAAAQLRHPGIVSVHEVVRLADGSAALVADFIDGVTLREMLQAGPLSPRDGAMLVMAVAEALNYAHGRQVVHRDIKPANILVEVVGGEAGRTRLRPLVTDFGLALRENGESTLTQEGQVLGTPVYMSPEQARGESHRVDQRTDVYSFGAVLYELLCGVPPFRGSTVEVLEQVQSQEPVRPRKVNAAAPRALEAICLKCLEKDPAQRYATAGEVAAELGRYLRDEPVLTRPPGPLGRAARWVRRRPTAAALLAAMVLLAVAGGIGLRFVLKAARARHEEELTLARSFTRPLGQGDASAPLSETELDALWKLAELENDRVRVLFLDEALAEPEVAVRLGRRAEFAVQAAVGLDEGRRQQALEVLRRRLAASPADPRVRSACIEIGVALRDGPEVHMAVEGVVSALTGTADPSILRVQGARLGDLAEAASPDDADRAAARVFTILAKTHSPETVTILGRALAALAERMQSDRARAMAFAGASAQMLPAAQLQSLRANNFASPLELRARRESMRPLAARLNPDDAAAAAERTLDWLASVPANDVGSIHDNPYPVLAVEDLAVLSERMRRNDGLAAAERAMDIVKQARNRRTGETLAHAAEVLAGALKEGERAKSARLCFMAKVNQSQQMNERVQARVDSPGQPPALLNPLEELTRLAAEMKPDEIASTMEQTLDLVEKAPDPLMRQRLAEAVLLLARRLSDDPAMVPPAAVQRVLQTIAGTGDVLVQKTLSQTAMHPAMRQNELAVGDVFVLKTLGQSVERLAGKLSPADAEAVARQAINVLEKTENPAARWALVEAAASLAGRLKPEDDATLAGTAVRRAVLASAKVTDEDGPVGPATRKPLLPPKADHTENREGQVSLTAAKIAELLPDRIKPEDAIAAAQKALAILPNQNRSSPTCTLVAALENLAERINPADASELAGSAAHLAVDSLLQIAQSVSDDRVKILGKAVATQAPHLKPTEAAAAARQVLDAMSKTPLSYNDASDIVLSEALLALAARMEPADAEALVRQGLDAIANSDWHPRADSLGKGTAAVAGRVRPAEAAAMELRAIDALSQAPVIARAAHKSAIEKCRALGDIAVGLALNMNADEAASAAQRAVAAASRTQEGQIEDFEVFVALGTVIAALGERVKPDSSPGRDVLTALGRSLTSRSRGSPEVPNTLRTLAAVLADPEKLNDPSVVAEAVRKILPSISHSQGEPVFVKAMEVLVPQLKPEDAAAAIRQASEVMRVSINPSYSSTAEGPMAAAVAVLARRVNPGDAATLAQQALKEMNMFHAKVVAALVERMNPEDITAAVNQVLDPLTQPKDFWGCDDRFEAVTALARRMTQEDAAASAQRLVSAMAKSPNGAILLFQAKMVLLLAARLEAEAGAAVTRLAADQTIRTMIRHPDFVHDVLRNVVPALIQRMQPSEAEAVAGAAVGGAIEALAKIEMVLQATRLAHAPPYTASEYALKDLAEAGRALAVKVNSTDAATALERGLDVMSQTSNPGLLKLLEGMLANPRENSRREYSDPGMIMFLEVVLPALAARIKAEDASTLAQRALDNMTRTTDSAALGSLGRAAAVLAGRMEDKAGAAVVVAAALRTLAVMGKADDRLAPWRSGKGVIAQAAPLASNDTRARAQQVLDAFNGLSSGENCQRLGTVVQALAASMEPETAAALAGVTAQQFLDALGDADHAWKYLSGPGRGSNGYVSPDRQASMAAGIAARRFATGMAALAERMKPGEAAVISGQAARLLLAAMANAKGKGGFCDLGQAVALLAARMESKAAEAVAEAAAERVLELTSSQRDAEDDYDLLDLLEAIAALVPRMNPLKAAATARTTVQHMRPSARDQLRAHNLAISDPAAAGNDQRAIRQPLARLAARMDPDDAAAAVQQALDASAEAGAVEGYRWRSERVEGLLTRCTLQGLVDLLKQPTCVGERRRVLLREWGNRYQQSTRNIWEFAAWVREHEPNLNLKSPPRLFPTENRP